MGRAASSRHRVIERTAFQRRVPKPGEASFSDHRSSSYEGSVKFLNRRSTLQTGELNPPAVIKLEPASAASTRPMEFARIGGRRGKSPWQRIACPIRCDNPAGPPTSTKRRFAPLFEVRLYRGGEARGHAAMTVRLRCRTFAARSTKSSSVASRSTPCRGRSALRRSRPNLVAEPRSSLPPPEPSHSSPTV